jgi:DNA-binding Xre family transcriptional regulator
VRGHVKHRLLELIHAKEAKLRRRLLMSEIAEGAGVSERLIYRWLDPNEEIKRFDEAALAGFCKYFEVTVGELLVYEPEDEEGTATE